MRELAICGFGAAGSGLLLAAANAGRWEDLAGGGVVAYDRQPLASHKSSLADYEIVADSDARAFLELLAEPARRLLDGLEASPETRALPSSATDHPSLIAVGRFLGAVTRRLAARLDEYPGCEYRGGVPVARIDVQRESVTVYTATGARERYRRAVLAMGGVERMATGTRVLSAIADRGMAAAIVPSSVVFKSAGVQAMHGTATILGGGHSAYAAAAALARARPPARVTIVQRRPPSLFFASADEALRARYPFKDRDVCTLTRRINRLGGLRGPARELALALRAGSRDDVRVITAPGVWHLDGLIAAGGFPTELAVVALGYLPRLPVLTSSGSQISLIQCDGLIDSGVTGEVRDRSGQIVPNLYAFGLGAGLRQLASLGGEPGYTGRLDGIWLYQHAVGAAVLESLLA